MKLSLYNTLTRKIENFTPIDQNSVRMYVCGPTVYDYPHIGNARSVVIYDLLYRLLINQYGNDNVLYVRNITDVDDKIINRCKETGKSIYDITTTTIKYFHDDMDYLGCLKPNIEPKATDHIKEMIEIIQLLLDKGCAYQADNHVFFRISKAEQYTKLSGRSLDDLLDGVRIESNTSKENSGDFVLWKPADNLDIPSANFESPFGLGRPGWHIECSAMSHKYLGKTFDIHGGGIDLIFPHHTNEIAQSCCAHDDAQYAKFWVHNGFLTVDKNKMSKSLGNFKTVKDIRNDGIVGDVARLFLLSTHYRKPLDYNIKALNDAQKMLSYWYRAIEINKNNFEDNDQDIPTEFTDALLNDMNISVALRIINDLAKSCHAQQPENSSKLLACAKFLGLMRQNPEEWLDNQQSNINSKRINLLVEKRNALKSQKKWSEADAIRDSLNAENIIIEDKPGGVTTWRKK